MKTRNSKPQPVSKQPQLWGQQAARLISKQSVVIAASVVVYILIFFPLYQKIGTGAFALALIVVLVTGSLSGIRSALWISAFLYIIGIGLSLAVGTTMFFATIGGLPGLGVMLLVGAGIGYFRDLNVRLKDEIATRKEAEIALQETNELLAAYLSKIETLQDGLREQAVRDPLTNLYNRRYLEETLENELSLAKRRSSQLSLVAIDVDNFKDFNDRYGHKAGDFILQTVGHQLQSVFRHNDIPFRYGGDEFVVVIPEAAADVVQQRVKQLLLTFEEMGVDFEAETLRCTLSIGIAVYPTPAATKEELMRMADLALYAAKDAGRNCIVVWK